MEPVRESLWERAADAKQAGLLTVDEARELMGYASNDELNATPEPEPEPEPNPEDD